MDEEFDDMDELDEEGDFDDDDAAEGGANPWSTAVMIAAFVLMTASFVVVYLEYASKYKP